VRRGGASAQSERGVENDGAFDAVDALDALDALDLANDPALRVRSGWIPRLERDARRVPVENGRFQIRIRMDPTESPISVACLHVFATRKAKAVPPRLSDRVTTILR
jgi:hypothetical protein